MLPSFERVLAIQVLLYISSHRRVVFWLGDLNYRIQTSDTFNAETIKQWANLYQLQELTSKDQVSVYIHTYIHFCTVLAVDR